MKPIIGIIFRKSKSSNKRDIKIIYYDIMMAVIKSGGIPIGIDNYNIDDYYNICSGFILQGGDLIEDKNLEILRKLNNINIPVLGICLGMQEMGLAFSGNLVDISLEVEEKNHDIKINNNTLLYSIVKTNYITVNSRHKSVVRDTNLIVSAVNGDIIEAIEDTNKRFFLGIQWHPENMYDTDIYAKRIFDYFIKMCHH